MFLKRIHKYFIVGLFVITPIVNATSPCRIAGGCIDEASATLVGLMDVYGLRCPDVDRDHAEQYRKKVNASFITEDARFLKRLRASAIYAKVVKEIEVDFNKMDQSTKSLSCEDFFNRM
jgi:hypothetical protein